MAEYFTTEKTVNCKKCGAKIEGNVKYCPFCGNVAETESPEKDAYDWNTSDENGSYDWKSSFDREVTDVRKVDIVSKVNLQENNKIVMGFMIFFLIMWVGIGGSVTAAFASMGTGIAILPGLMVVAGAVLVGRQIVSGVRCGVVKKNAAEYRAVVLDHSISTDSYGAGKSRRVRTTCKIKVLADIDGCEKCILINAGNGHAKSLYPVGCTVTVCGEGDYWIIKN